MIVSSLSSQNIYPSLYLSFKLIVIWVLFACAFDYLNSGINSNLNFLNALNIVLIGLVLYALIEFLLQTYVIPNWLRTSFSNIEEYKFMNTRILFRNNLILSQGPFTWNHGLGGVLCSLLGMMLFKFENNKVTGSILAILFFLAILTNGMRSVYIATSLGLIVWCLYRFNLRNILRLGICILISFGVYSTKANPKNVVFYNEDMKVSINEYLIHENFRLDSSKTAKILSKFIPYEFSTIKTFLDTSGTFSIRLIGFVENVSNYKQWWLTGYGVGAFQKPGVIQSKAIQYNDPGLIMLFLFEFGLFPFLIIMLLIILSFCKSIKNENWMLGIGIASWFVFSLSSWAIWPMLLISVFITKILKS